MKKIIPILFAASTTFLSAEHYLQLSVGNANPDSDGAIQRNLNTGTSLSEGTFTAIEYGFASRTMPQLSYGFEFALSDTSASAAGNFDDEDVSKFNTLLQTSSIAIGESSLTEEYDIKLLMFNLNYEYVLTENLSLNLLAGFGMLDLEQKITFINPGLSFKSEADETVFAYQLGAKLGYAITDSITLLAGARLVNAGKVEFTHRTDDYVVSLNGGNADTVTYEASIRYTF